MNKTTVYLAGGMTNLSIEEQTEWRNRATAVLTAAGINVIDPTKVLPVWRDEMSREVSDREIVVSNKFHILNSDIILAEFLDGRPISLGTVGEVVHNGGRKPVISFGSAPVLNHCWISEHITVKFAELGQALDYIVCNYRR